MWITFSYNDSSDGYDDEDDYFYIGLKLLTPLFCENCLISGFSSFAELKTYSTEKFSFLCGVGMKSRLLMLLRSCEGSASTLPYELISPVLDS